ncbi:MAG: cohesin domain-containing protein [Bacteroidota bacterium]
MKKYILLGLLCSLLFTVNAIGSVTFIMNNYSASSGSYITIPIKVNGFTNVMSIQGTIQFDPAILNYTSIQDYGLSDMNSSFGVTQAPSGIITFSWIEGSLSGVTLADSTTIFSITFHVVGAVGTNSALLFVNAPTLFEVLDPSNNVLPNTWSNGSVHIYTTVSIPEIENKGFQLFQNEPNPVSDNTHIVFFLPIESEVTLSIYDILGNCIWSLSKVFSSGINTYNVNTDNINGTKLRSGTYYFRIISGEYSDVKKMLVIK